MMKTLTGKSNLLFAGHTTILLLFGIFVTILIVILIAGPSTVGTFVWKWFLQIQEEKNEILLAFDSNSSSQVTFEKLFERLLDLLVLLEVETLEEVELLLLTAFLVVRSASIFNDTRFFLDFSSSSASSEPFSLVGLFDMVYTKGFWDVEQIEMCNTRVNICQRSPR